MECPQDICQSYLLYSRQNMNLFWQVENGNNVLCYFQILFHYNINNLFLTILQERHTLISRKVNRVSHWNMP